MASDNDPNAGVATLYDTVLDEIATGQLLGGQRLKVSELAARFGISASPVREMLRQMHGEGFVEINPNRGATVKASDPGRVQNIFEVLQLLEPYAVKWFAEDAPVDAIDRMQAIQDQIKAAPPDDALGFTRLDTQFHAIVFADHYNDVATETWKKLRVALSVHSAPLRISMSRRRNIIEEHDMLIAAFRDRNAPRAEQVIQQHLHGAYVQMSRQIRAIDT
ncbi:GntR family transcriptional regulator [Marinovum sp. 2_MG-2023]|uniref:GntR family transcriptional regulator n=1 Tax=Roseobacteraceae TaxID=2854170 RepID=UPI001FCF859E|nr:MULTISPECIES: GntR family transcriptional regulator [Roseobacteraceae]MCJ7873585.1 GntR family transcriptional regulator [Phaeobacter sp. J2-8]MDO6728966.1 GntR family transcriptional regulator [Marinovum sp. 2_MG-2023]MDO6779407.1 GntR family transcriptional regulator [Marinovum sp. 1_MG-2023]